MIRLIWRIALRNVLAHRMKSVIIGMIFALGALVGVVGNALVDAMEAGMARSIIDSMAGHLQVHSSEGRDPLAIYGDEFAGMPDFGMMPDFARVAEVIRGVPGVRAVIPMGSQIAFSDKGNLLDRKLQALRLALAAGDRAAVADTQAHLSRIVDLLVTDLEGAEALGDTPEVQARIVAARRVQAPGYWDRFDAAPAAELEFLENQVAPAMAQPGMLPIWFLGTDLDRFAMEFPRFKIVRGAPVPPRTRGFLFNDGVYEELVKHRAAWAFDKLTKAAKAGDRIEDDPILRGHRDTLAAQSRNLLLQLGPRDSEAVAEVLRTHLKSDAGLEALLDRFLAVDDATLSVRNALFYKEIAPRIEVYGVQVGDVLTLRSFTRSGYARAVNLKVYGTFAFDGLEASTITAQHNLVDLISFRELFGHATPESQAEIAAMRAQAGIADVERAGAEDALFGGGEPLVAEAETIDATPAGALEVQRALSDTFRPEDVERGMALHAAVLLHRGDPETIAAAKAAVQAAVDAAGLKINVLTWQEASGLVGQIVLMIRLVLLVIVGLLSVVALVIINNSMVMATMDRVAEIGTMRAIGAQRRFVTNLFMTESLVLALIAGTIGALLGAGIVLWMGASGVAATNDFATFLYSGPALHPSLAVHHVVWAVVNVAVVGIVSTFYPASIAGRIPPVEAMASRG